MSTAFAGLGADDEESVDDVAVLKAAVAIGTGRKGQVRVPLLAALLDRLPGWGSERVVGEALMGSSDENWLARRFNAPGVHRNLFDFGDIKWAAPAFKTREGWTFVTAHNPEAEAEVRAQLDRAGVLIGDGPAPLGKIRIEKFEVAQPAEGAGRNAVILYGKVWLGAEGWKATAPTAVGKKAEREHTTWLYGRNYSNGIAEDPGFWTWAYKQTTLQADAQAYADAGGGAAVVKERQAEARGEMENTGICPVCGRRQKLSRPRAFGKGPPLPLMVDHGYQMSESGGWGFRAHGERLGACWGVGHPPWELSDEGLQHFLVEGVRKWIVSARASLERALVEGSPVDVTKRNHMTRKDENLTLHPGDDGYKEAFARRQRDREQELKLLERTRDDVEAKLTTWKRIDLYDEKKAGARMWP